MGKKEEPKTKKNAINRVTTKRLSMVLSMVGISVSDEMVDKLIDAVELIEKHGGNTSLKHVANMEMEWLEGQ